MIIGRWSDVTDTFHVVDLVRAPSDSVFSAGEFTLGVEGLADALDRIIERAGLQAPAALPRTAALSRGPSSPRRCWAFPPPTP